MVFKKVRIYVFFDIFLLILLFFTFLFNKNIFQGTRAKTSPYISVIVPVYNTEQYLPKCLDSLVNQTYKNIEIICVNDGSKDNSLQVLKEYENRDNRIKVIDKENGGVSSARNAGIDASKGKYISFVDSDDYIDLDMYEIIVSSLGNGNYTFLTFGYVNEPEEEKRPIESGVFNASDFLYLPYPVGYSVNTIYERSFINENNLRFAPSVSVGEDNLFIQMCILKSKNEKIKIISNKMYHYVYRGSGRYSDEKILKSILERGRLLLEFCKSNKIVDKYDWAINFSVDLMYDKIRNLKDTSKKKESADEAIKIISDKEFEGTLKNAPNDTIYKINKIKFFSSNP